MERKAQGLVIGGGPAGLMAAERMAMAGMSVMVAEAKPSLGRKLLMAGKSGLNLTKDEAFETFMSAYDDRADWLRPMVAAFDGDAAQDWTRGLGQAVFRGSSGRVFPEAMKASPLMRAWLTRLAGMGVEWRTRWRWTGWDDAATVFDTPDGVVQVRPDVTVLALGGASWAKLGSDGLWAVLLRNAGVALAPFEPANAAVSVDWSAHMQPLFGAPLKGVRFTAGRFQSRGEAVITQRGLEGSGIYAVSRGVRDGNALTIDLFADLSPEALTARLARPRGKVSLSNHLRKTLKPGAARMGLLNECARPLPRDPETLARLMKSLPIPDVQLRPLDEAISTAGGVCQSALTDQLMLRARPGVFCAGEMLDWEAPTGGYLLTACLATGRWAGEAAAQYAQQPGDHS